MDTYSDKHQDDIYHAQAMDIFANGDIDSLHEVHWQVLAYLQEWTEGYSRCDAFRRALMDEIAERSNKS